MADSIEAIIAAIFFDGGIEEADKFIIDNLEEAMEQASKNVGKRITRQYYKKNIRNLAQCILNIR